MELIDLGYEKLQSALTQRTEKEKLCLSETFQKVVPDMDGFLKFLYSSIELNLKEYFLPRPTIITIENRIITPEAEKIKIIEPTVKIYFQSAFNSWQHLQDNSIQSIVVSPPYFQFRRYKIPDVIIGGNPSCTHKFVEKGENGGFCTYCNAWTGQYGWEPDYKLYIEHTLLWCKEAWRVLKNDGIFFLNMGDKYMDKCKLLLPHRVAIALNEKGWIPRNDNIWHRMNCMPHPVKDRFSNRFEYVFMFTKSKKYFFDLNAVREPHKPQSLKRTKSSWNGHREPHSSSFRMDMSRMCHPNGKNPGDLWVINTQPSKIQHYAMFPEKLVERMILCSTKIGDSVLDAFCGSATTLMVAKRLGRKAYGIDLGYEEVQKQRLSGVQRRKKC